MRKILLALVLCFAAKAAFAENPYRDEKTGRYISNPKITDTSFREIFRKTEGTLFDWTILSSVEAGYFRDLINEGDLVGVQFPILYVTPYISADFGYISGYDDKQRGALMFGGSIRLNKLLEDAFTGDITSVRSYVPVVDSNWDKLWFGPWVAKRFSDLEDPTLLAGIKAGISW